MQCEWMDRATQQDSLDGLGVESLVFEKLKAQHRNFDEFLILLN